MHQNCRIEKINRAYELTSVECSHDVLRLDFDVISVEKFEQSLKRRRFDVWQFNF